VRTDEEIVQEVMSEIVGMASDPIDDPATYFSEYYDVQRDKTIERTDEEYNRYREIASRFEFEKSDDPHVIIIRYKP